MILYDNVIFIAPYPLKKRIGGGLIRSGEIRNGLKAASRNFIELFVYDEKIWGKYDDVNNFTMSLSSPERIRYGNFSNYCADLDIVDWCNKQDSIIRYATERVVDGNILIWFEYPWLWKLAESIFNCFRNSGLCHVVYSSGNIEHEVYKEITKRNGVSDYHALVDTIKKIEVSAISLADICVACSKYDLNALSGMGAKKTIVAPNGVNRITHSNEKITSNKLYGLLSEIDYFFYAASDWPPNVANIDRIIGANLGYIEPNKKIVVAGGASRVFNEVYLNKSSYNYNLNNSRLIVLGMLDYAEYATAHALATGYFLPVGYGGGTCLKTAEAIYTGKPTLATISAMRGYDQFIDFPNVNVASDDEFSRKLGDLLSVNTIGKVFDSRQVKILENLTWNPIISDLTISIYNYLYN